MALDAEDVLNRVERELRSLWQFLVRRERLNDGVDSLGRNMRHGGAERKTVDTRRHPASDREIKSLRATFQ
jgi:hypothetical protein